MKDMIFAFIHQYAVWGILFVLVLALIVLHCMYRQMRKLNRSLGMVTAKVQQYFDIIMKDEEEEEDTRRRAAYNDEESARRRAAYNDQEGARRRAVHSDEEQRPWPREEDFQLTKGEREMLLSDRSNRNDRRERKNNKNQEEVLDAVLQEYFS